MKTMTRLMNVEEKGQSVVVTLLGDKVAGTQDAVLGQKLMDIFTRDPENCLVSLHLDKRGDKLWVTGVDYEAPPELGGPADEEFEVEGAVAPSNLPDGVDSTVEIKTELRADLPTPIITLEQLITVEERVEKIEQFLATKGYEA